MSKIIIFPGHKAVPEEDAPSAAEILRRASDEGVFDDLVMVCGVNTDGTFRIISNAGPVHENWILDHVKHILIRDSMGLDD